MKLIILTGPPAVGKMTVGQTLQNATGLKLFHNHLSLELVNQFFDWGTPSLKKLDKLFRFEIFKEVAKSDLKGLIFTIVWAFDLKEDEVYIDEIIDIFKKEGSAIHIVELKADLSTRIERNKGENRLKHKPSKRDIVASEKRLLQNEKRYRLNSLPDEFREKHILKIDNTHLSPEMVAQIIIEKFNLQR